MVRDLKGLHLEGSAEVVTGDFPTCWEVEVMDNGYKNAEVGDEDENRDVYVRYVKALVDAMPCVTLPCFRVLAFGFRFPGWQ